MVIQPIRAEKTEITNNEKRLENAVRIDDNCEKWQNSIELSDDISITEERVTEKENNPEDFHQTISSDVSKEQNIDNEPYPCCKVIDGKKHYYDSNGELYRVENQLSPNNTYEINGYRYNTDKAGRVISAEGQLHLKAENRKHLPIKDSIEAVGKGDQKENDDRGHLIGDQFDGSNGLENLIPQNSDINRKDYKNLENELAGKIKAGDNVYFKVEPIYGKVSNRPLRIEATYVVNGKESTRERFPNN